MTSTIDKIRAEIERQMKYYEEKEMREWDEQNDEDALWDQGHRKMCSKLLSFLDTLPEQPANEGLEEAAERWCKENGRGFVLRDKAAYYIGETLPAFKAGAEWMADKMKGK